MIRLMLRVLGLIKTPLFKTFVDYSHGKDCLIKRLVFIRVLQSSLLIEISSWKFRAFKTKDKTFVF
jgi:hypothetical protein